ncbi:MAG: DUF5752 family protein, partial [Candidatus Woesearchaeota archaeon]
MNNLKEDKDNSQNSNDLINKTETKKNKNNEKRENRKLEKKEKQKKETQTKKKKDNTEKTKEKNKNLTKIMDAKPEHYFILVTGVPLKNIKELALALQTMDEWVFHHHVNHERNDFSNWIKDIFNEDALAEELREIKNIHETEKKLLRHLVSKYL